MYIVFLIGIMVALDQVSADPAQDIDIALSEQ